MLFTTIKNKVMRGVIYTMTGSRIVYSLSYLVHFIVQFFLCLEKNNYTILQFAIEWGGTVFAHKFSFIRTLDYLNPVLFFIEMKPH